MGLHRMGPPTLLILELKQRLGIADFVETGTYRGDTTEWAAKNFARVVTIELSPEFHRAAQSRFQDRHNVKPLQGDSAAVLAQIVPGLVGLALFWLDAHWSGLDTAGQSAECPLLAEVAAINAARVTHPILVDDARLFCAPPPRPHRAEQWPDLVTTVAALSDGGRRHVVLFEDVFVAVPSAERGFLTNWIQDAAAEPAGKRKAARWWAKLRS